MKKKLLAALLALCMVFALAACGGEPAGTAADQGDGAGLERDGLEVGKRSRGVHGSLSGQGSPR